MEKFNAIDRVVGRLPEEIKDFVFAHFKQSYLEQSLSKDKTLTPEQQERLQGIIYAADQATDEIRQEFGLPRMSVLAGSVKLGAPIEEDIFQSKGAFTFGHYNTISQEISVRELNIDSALFHAITHEMFHMKSYNAIQYTQEEEIAFYRSGLTVGSRDGEKKRFSVIDEAINEELVKRVLFQSEIKNFTVSEERRKTEENRELLSGIEEFNEDIKISDDTYYLSLVTLDDGNTELKGMKLGYSNERKALWLLIDRIFEQNEKDFSNRDEVLAVFIKAKLDGNILPLGKLIERTFGRGSFRKIGDLELEDSLENYEAMIKDL